LICSAAREAIVAFLQTKRKVMPVSISTDPRFTAKMGCFVTLKENNEARSLRGCIGYPEPVFELGLALTNAAIEAATRDPRFAPVKVEEMAKLLIEVSLLTSPVEIETSSQKDLLTKIEIGKDGLLMRWSFGSGLLLPQVATEYNWDPEEFLCNLSMKAGAPPDQWLVPGTRIYKFSALIFEEGRSGSGSRR
jgi:uncharacterized protein